MTDITKLAQSLKAAAEKAGIEQWVNNRGEVNTADYEVDDGMYIDHICDCEIVGTESPRAEFIALANPANILALVEALEKAQAKADVYDMLRDDYGLREKGVGLADFVDWQAKRIAELDSRAVKLPPKVDSSNIPFAGHTWNCCLDEVEKRLAAAGIKWEAE